MADRPAADRTAAERLAAERTAVRHQRPVRGARPPRRPPVRRVSRIRIWLRRVVALGAIVGAAVIVWFLIEIYQPFAGNGHGRITVTIPADSGTDRIASILAGDGVISSSFFFELRVRLDGSKLYAGRFTMPLATSNSRAIQILSVEPKAITESVTVIDGLSRRQIAARLRVAGIHGNYLANTRHSKLLDPVAYGAPKSTPYLEGFLYPDTYQLRKPVSVKALVAQQLVAFKSAFATVGLGYARAHHLTPYDILIVASLTEAEATTNHDRPLVAAVIYNRLARGMDLGFDTTVAYATGDYSGTLTARELNSRSPWNTTNHRGLPPTPIDSPSLEAINAAAHPARTSALYFITKVCGNGSLAFASSYSAFQQLSAQYNAAFAKHGLRGAEFCRK